MRGQIWTKDGVLIYAGEIENGRPSGQGTMYWPDGQVFREGTFNGKGLIDGCEYYTSGQLRHAGKWRINTGYGPNVPVSGRVYMPDGKLCFAGTFMVRQSGLGWTTVITPEEYGPVMQKDAPYVDTAKTIVKQMTEQEE